MAAPTTTVLLPLLLFYAFSSYPAYAITQKYGRQGDLGDIEAQDETINQLTKQLPAMIVEDMYYGPNKPVATLSADLNQELRLHATFMTFDAGICTGGERVGAIQGLDITDTFTNIMLQVIQRQIRDGYGFGMVTVCEDDLNLSSEGLLAQFYYWVEKIGAINIGGATSNTQEAAGPSDDNVNRHHDDLSLILGAPNGNPTSLLTGIASNFTSFNNMKNQGKHVGQNITYQVQPPHYVADTKLTRNSSKRIRAQKDSTKDCLPYKSAIFTSLDDINVLAAPSLGSDHPDLIYSQSEEFFLIMQDDCNMVLYQRVGNGKQRVPLWACTDACYNNGKKCFARINFDGTFVVYNSDGNPLWWTPTQCSSGLGCWSNTYLVMQDDGNLVLYLLDTGVPLWASNTQVYN